MVAASLGEFQGASLWVSRAKSGQALAKLAKTREAHSALKMLAERVVTIPESASCGRVGKVWLQTTQETVATLDRRADEMVWNEAFLTRLGTSASAAQQAAAEIRRERQFL
jgi:hypothetical protein